MADADDEREPSHREREQELLEKWTPRSEIGKRAWRALDRSLAGRVQRALGPSSAELARPHRRDRRLTRSSRACATRSRPAADHGAGDRGQAESMAPRILVVDDDPSVLRMLERTLSGEGYESRPSPTAARRYCRRAPGPGSCPRRRDAGLDGLAVCRRLRARGLGVPIVLLTARDAVADRVAALRQVPTISRQAVRRGGAVARLAAITRRDQSTPELLVAGRSASIGTRRAAATDRGADGTGDRTASATAAPPPHGRHPRAPSRRSGVSRWTTSSIGYAPTLRRSLVSCLSSEPCRVTVTCHGPPRIASSKLIEIA